MLVSFNTWFTASWSWVNLSAMLKLTFALSGAVKLKPHPPHTNTNPGVAWESERDFARLRAPLFITCCCNKTTWICAIVLPTSWRRHRFSARGFFCDLSIGVTHVSCPLRLKWVTYVYTYDHRAPLFRNLLGTTVQIIFDIIIKTFL